MSHLRSFHRSNTERIGDFTAVLLQTILASIKFGRWVSDRPITEPVTGIHAVVRVTVTHHRLSIHVRCVIRVAFDLSFHVSVLTIHKPTSLHQ